MTTYDRAEVEEAFRHYYLTGIVGEDWVAWSQLFTEDATYTDHFYGTFNGPLEIQKFLESTMSFCTTRVLGLGLVQHRWQSDCLQMHESCRQSRARWTTD